MRRLINVLISLDNFLFSLLTLGGAYPGESFSSAAWRSEGMGGIYGKYTRPFIDWIFSVLFGQTGHCMSAYYSAKHNLPKDMQ